MIWIILVIVAFLGASADDHAEASINFKEDTFAEQVAKKPHFVMFFAPWCGHCKRLAPTWQDLSVKYNEKEAEDQDVLIGKVDCTVETALCSSQDVTGYPTLKFFKTGTDSGVKYRGQRDLDSLVKFINQQMGLEQAEDAEKDADKKAESEEAIVDNGLWVLSEKSFTKHVESGHHFIKFYAPWCGHCQKLAPAWADLAKAHEDSPVKVAKLDCTQAQSICKDNQVRGYPTLHFIKDGKIVETYKGGRDLASLKDFVATMTDNAGEQAAKAEEEVKSSDVAMIDKDSFEQTVKEGVVFVKFFAPWCGHCKRLAPIWEELATKLAGKAKVGKVDCTEGNDRNRELCNAQGVTGFPTLNIYKNGEKIEEYKGKRTVEELEAFVNKHLEVPKDEL